MLAVPGLSAGLLPEQGRGRDPAFADLTLPFTPLSVDVLQSQVAILNPLVAAMISVAGFSGHRGAGLSAPPASPNNPSKQH